MISRLPDKAVWCQRCLILLLLLPAMLFAQKRYLGADLSYVNEIEDCGAHFRSQGQDRDPYALFAQKGANLVRLRLWHQPELNSYSGFEDVRKSIRRAKEQHVDVLLDFHYSDTWADPEKQYAPKAWSGIADMEILGDSLYAYTLNTLLKLHRDALLPEIVQVGNETNQEILQPYLTHKEHTDWTRNAYLFNRAIAAVREASRRTGHHIGVLLHIAQPENALEWFAHAKANGIVDFDWIGISYYPLWSSYAPERLPEAIRTLVSTYKKPLLIVETAYPHTLQNADKANNILDQKALVSGFPATPQGQKDYMVELAKIVFRAGGSGVIYWEPAWVSSGCRTLWGEGSHWDNATFFDAARNNEALPAFDFYDMKQYQDKP